MQKDLKARFEKFIKNENLFKKDEKAILGLSGGKDSMVLAALLHDCGYDFIAAHCNFHLRGKQSDADQLLVEEWCEKNNIELHVTHFQTKEYAQEHQISIEMAARDLRYAWFRELKMKHGAQYICIAHHLNDQIETFFLNLARGTGIKGLVGMKVRNGAIIRPLLFAGRQEIDAYAARKAIPYRKDLSNDDVKLKRNFIRHKVIPLLGELNPSILETMQTNMKNLSGVTRFLENQFAIMEQNLIEKNENETNIKIPQDHTKDIFTDFLLQFFSKEGMSFTPTQIRDILDAQPGAEVKINNYNLYREREALLLKQSRQEIPEPAIINSLPQKIVFGDYQFEFSEKKLKNTGGFPRENDEIWLNRGNIKFPLTIRSWQAGDKISPLGMEGTKKVKKILTDKKIKTSERMNYPVVCDAENIIWIPYYTVNRLYKITDIECAILSIKVIKSR